MTTPKKRSISFGKGPDEERIIERLMSSESSVEEDVDSQEDEEDEVEEEEEEVILPTPVKRRGGRPSKGGKQQVDELDSARLKLDDVLALISKGELQEDEFDEDEDHTDSALSPPQKLRRTRGPRKSRKRMREDGFMKTSSFILKLFDRSVDVAQFSINATSEDVPLYPVCRAWIRNQAQPPYVGETQAMDPEDHTVDEKPVGIYHLPAPQARPKDDNGQDIDTRLPKSLRKPQTKPLDIDQNINSLQEEPYHNLLHDNVIRWRAVRQDWRQASQDNEARYRHSCDVLRSMYERSLSAQASSDQPTKSENTGSDSGANY
jgi:hypothetical protein